MCLPGSKTPPYKKDDKLNTLHKNKTKSRKDKEKYLKTNKHFNNIPIGKTDRKKGATSEDEDCRPPNKGFLLKTKNAFFKYAPGQYEYMFGQTNPEGYCLQETKYKSYSLSIPISRMPLIHYIQNHQWREIFISGPTRNSAGNLGNDFPGFYYYDPLNQEEWVVMIDGLVDWKETKCSRWLHEDILRIGITNSKIPLDHTSLKYWKRRTTIRPTRWDSLSTLIDQSFRLKPLPVPNGSIPDWHVIAKQTLTELESEHLLINRLGVIGYPSILEDADSASLELLTHANIARALLMIEGYPGFEKGQRISDRLIKEVIPVFFDDNLRFFVNDYPRKDNSETTTVFETWYLLSNLKNLLSILLWGKAENLKEMLAISLDRIVDLTRSMDYIFPLFIDVSSGASYGQCHNISALGIYAAVCVLGAAIFHSNHEGLLAEAEHALQVMRRFPFETLYHEPFQLSLAAYAADRLALSKGSDEFIQWRDDFIRLLLLNLYRDRKFAGLFQCCAGMMYPAFKENVECLEPLCNMIGHSKLPLKKIFSLSLRKNRAYFVDRKETNKSFPCEALNTSEMPNAFSSGTAIYAAAQVFDMLRIQMCYSAYEQRHRLKI